MKYLATASKTRVIFRKITKDNRPLAVVYDRLYRVDDDLCCTDIHKPNSFVLYDIEEQQPYGAGDYLDPELTKVLIGSMKLGRGKVNKMFDFNSEIVVAVIIAGAVLFSILQRVLSG